MDMAPPLIHLYTKICSLGEGEAEDQAKSAAQVILQQWGRAFYHISQRRRRSEVSLVDPAFEYLLSSPSAYVPGKETVELLLTDAFLQSMLKEATQDVTLANSSAAREKAKAGVRKTSRPDPSTRVLRPRKSEAIRYTEERQRSDGRRERAAPARSWLRGGDRYVAFSLSDSSKAIVNCKKDEIVKVGARILDFTGNWSKITDDVWMLDCVTNGVKFDFLEHPKQFRRSSPVPMSADMLKVCDLEVKELLKKRAVVEVTGTNSDGFVCALFVIPKKAGGFRPIVNLKPLNKFIKYEHFKMENLYSARYILREGYWMVKLDLNGCLFDHPCAPVPPKVFTFCVEWAYVPI